MVWDFEEHPEPPRLDPSSCTADLSTLLLIAGIELSTSGATFTFDELVALARDIAGSELPFEDEAVRALLVDSKAFVVAPGGRLRLT